MTPLERLNTSAAFQDHGPSKVTSRAAGLVTVLQRDLKWLLKRYVVADRAMKLVENPTALPQIVGVAIKFNGATITMPRPNRHPNIVRAVGGIGGPDVQGFVDDKGRFLGRKDAYRLALKNGQLNRRPGAQLYQGDDLYSEDLW